MAKIETEAIRNIFADHKDPEAAREALLAFCDEMDQVPPLYGFEFVVDDEHFGNEGMRDNYYLWKLPQDRCPDAFTASVYIEAVESNPGSDGCEIARYIGIVLDDQGERVFDTDEDSSAYLETCGACVEDSSAGPFPRSRRTDSNLLPY